MPNGASEELQIVPRPVLQANRKEHHDYKKARNAELEGQGAEPARATARAINDRAMDRFNSKNGVSPQIAKGAVRQGLTSKTDRRRGGKGRLRRSKHAHRARAHRRRKEHHRPPQRSAPVLTGTAKSDDKKPQTSPLRFRGGIQTLNEGHGFSGCENQACIRTL